MEKNEKIEFIFSLIAMLLSKDSLVAKPAKNRTKITN